MSAVARGAAKPGLLAARRCLLAAIILLLSVVSPVAPAGAPAPAAGPAGSEPSASKIVERMRAAVQAIRDARVRIEAEAVDARGRSTRSVVAVWILRSPGLVRLEVVEPAVLADQVYVVDFERLRLLVYLPVTNQVVVQTFEQAFGDSAQAGPFSPEQLLAVGADGDAADLQLAGTEARGKQVYYVLEGDAPAPPSQARQQPAGRSPLPVFIPPQASRMRLWVDGSTWLMERLAFYDASGRMVGSLVLRDLQVNTGLRPADLRRLPQDAEIVEG